MSEHLEQAQLQIRDEVERILKKAPEISDFYLKDQLFHNIITSLKINSFDKELIINQMFKLCSIIENLSQQIASYKLKHGDTE